MKLGKLLILELEPYEGNSNKNILTTSGSLIKEILEHTAHIH